jgi:hypothetical protein
MSDANHFTVEWIDHGREPKCAANPAFPNGIDLNETTDETEISCRVELPYPAKRCGMYTIHCTLCGKNIGVTTAGRADDPKSIRLLCHMNHTKGNA